MNLNFEISNLLFAAQKTLQDRRGRPLRTARTEEANACELSALHALPRRRTEEGVGHAEALGLVSRARVRRRKRVASKAWLALAHGRCRVSPSRTRAARGRMRRALKTGLTWVTSGLTHFRCCGSRSTAGATALRVTSGKIPESAPRAWLFLERALWAPMADRTRVARGPAVAFLKRACDTEGATVRLQQSRLCGCNHPACPVAKSAVGARVRYPMLGLTQLSNYLTLKGSFSAAAAAVDRIIFKN